MSAGIIYSCQIACFFALVCINQLILDGEDLLSVCPNGSLKFCTPWLLPLVKTTLHAMCVALIIYTVITR